jgi:hypothetical protein
MAAAEPHDVGALAPGDRIRVDGRSVVVEAVSRRRDPAWVLAGDAVLLVERASAAAPDGGAVLLRLQPGATGRPTDPDALDEQLGEQDGRPVLRSADGRQAWPVEVQPGIALRSLGLRTAPHAPRGRRAGVARGALVRGVLLAGALATAAACLAAEDVLAAVALALPALVGLVSWPGDLRGRGARELVAGPLGVLWLVATVAAFRGTLEAVPLAVLVLPLLFLAGRLDAREGRP